MDSKYVVIDKSNTSKLTNGIFNGFSLKRKNGILPIEKSPKKLKNNVTYTNGNQNDLSPSTPKKNVNETNHVQQRSGNNQNGPIAINLFKQRQSLPVFLCKQRIITEITKSDTVLLMGETGSGKTTQIPQYLHESGNFNKGQIAVTQPRRVAAITIAKRVSQEKNTKLGELVGYTVRFEDCTSKQTKIKFMTDGILLREAIADRLLQNYSVIMLDEAHERTINTDVLFGIVKEAQKMRKLKGMCPLKVIVTSATMDIDHFSSYYGVKGMYLEGRTFPVKVMHAKEPQSDYVQSCLITLFQIHREAPPNHDILVFLTGQEEIETMAVQIRSIVKYNDLNAPTLRVFSLYSQMPQSRQLECFISTGPNTRKVILATNIAETSITIPGIRYVIDSGFVKRRIYDPITGMDSLKVVRISQAQSWQRCGRAGREAEGTCYRTYTKTEMENFELMPKPEILRSNICSTVLQLLAMGIDCRSFDFLDKPSPDLINSAFKQLVALGAIKNIANAELTNLGRKMVLFPLDPKFSKLLLNAPDYDCLDEMLSLVSIMSGESVLVKPNNERRDQASLAHAKFESKSGDHLTLLNIYKHFDKTEKIRLWCNDNFLNSRNLLYARDVRTQLEEICNRCELKISSCGQNLDKVRKCLLSGLFGNIAEYQQRDNCYLTLSSRQRAKIHPSSILCGKAKYNYVLFNEIVTTDKNFLRLVTAIEPDWIEEVVPNYPFLSRIQKTLN